MLLAKESRLRAVERKLSDNPQQGFMGRVVGSIRGNPDVQERSTLQLEIQGLETMRHTLQNSLTVLQTRRQSQLHCTRKAVQHHILHFRCVLRVSHHSDDCDHAPPLLVTKC
jgi:hypothetical protein